MEKTTQNCIKKKSKNIDTKPLNNQHADQSANCTEYTIGK
jgi:hypothetical protein